MTEGLTLLGAKVRQPVRQLETFDAPPHVTEVTMSSAEWTSLCPVTGQPDFGLVTIRYQPAGRCLESKSLKLYLWSFREVALFVEAFAAQVATDIQHATQAAWVDVTATQNARGGITTTATATITQERAAP